MTTEFNDTEYHLHDGKNGHKSVKGYHLEHLRKGEKKW